MITANQGFYFDLDGSMIFSHIQNEKSKILIDDCERGRSYCSLDMVHRLISLSEKLALIPTTARSLEQTTRLCFSNYFEIPYLITDNGSAIYVKEDGEYKKDEEWEKNIQSKRDSFFSFLLELSQYTHFLAPDKLIYSRLYNDAYLVFLFQSAENAADEMAGLLAYIKQSNHSLITVDSVKLVGRRIYILPSCINKKYAVEFFSKKYKISPFITYGDSKIDYDFIQLGVYQFGHTIVESEQFTSPNFYNTPYPYELGGEDVLKKVGRAVY